MNHKKFLVVAIVSASAGLVIGVCGSGWRHDQRLSQARYRNYTDRASICLEAAALLRSRQPDLARKYLEERALGAIRGVPMGRRYDELSADSQSLMVAAKLYDAKFDDVDWEIDRLSRGDVPDDHKWLSATLRSVTGQFGR